MAPRPIHLMPGIGPKSAQWLAEAGIETEEELRTLGAVAAYRRLKHRDPKRVTRNMLWSLHGALTGVPWNRIDDGTKRRLLAEAEGTPAG
ncbi:TfoX/Sxy family protein [Azospirillum sp.]|uniref:TfoX/Sxy family protein n=1 Tax=Azospirillum sp. TaxID=34012 RepID=UPI002D499D8B|nr:TfoX/Sxy family protein [Azospirillum sp.]HYD65196.1 TfoX/Sxy family protein [Azospirillum sp.]